MAFAVATAQPKWVQGFELRDFAVDGGPVQLFDWSELGANYTVLFFVVICKTGSLDALVEACYELDGDGVGVAEVGRWAPKTFHLDEMQANGDRYGLDESRPFWRLSVSGTASGRWGVRGIPR